MLTASAGRDMLVTTVLPSALYLGTYSVLHTLYAIFYAVSDAVFGELVSRNVYSRWLT